MSARGVLGAAALALALGAGAWWWSGREPAVDARIERAREGGREAQAICDAGRHDEAAERFLQAAELAEQAGDRALWRALRAQSAVPLKLAGRLDEAREILLPVLSQARAEGDARSEGLALGNLARVEDLAGNATAALGHLDELADFAAQQGDVRLEVWTLEQAAAAAAALRDPEGALARLERALARDDGLSDEDRRHDALLGQKAVLLAQSGDIEGAWTLWSALPVSAASLANRAVALARWDLHEQASDLARAAVQAFGEEGDRRRVERDQALRLHLSELIANHQPDVASERLDALFEAGGEDVALRPFRVLRARAALAKGGFGAAADELVPLLDDADVRATEPQLAHLAVVALQLAGRGAEAQSLAAELPDDLAGRVLRVWTLLGAPAGDGAVSEAVPGFRAALWSAADTSLARLRGLCPLPLPSPAFLAVEVGLADATRLRETGHADLAGAVLADAVREALVWQALDAMAAVPRLVPDEAGRRVLEGVVDAWVDGRLPEGEAVLAYVGGPTASYLLIMRQGEAPTTWSLAPARTLGEQAARTVEALHADLGAVGRAAHALYAALVPRGAQADLTHAEHWLILPLPEVAGVPPAVWVTEPPTEEALAAGEIAWFVRDRSATLLAHAPGPATAPVDGAAGWLTVGAPEVELDGLPLSSSVWLARFGIKVYNAGAPRALEGGDLLQGAAATVPATVAALAGRAGVRLSLPGAGAWQVGGLVFSPAPGAARGDDAGGLLTFARMAELPLPPLVVLDAMRFDPDDARYGPLYAATAVGARAHALLMTRWPIPVPLRDAVVRQVVEARAGGLPLGRALAAVQRDYLRAMSGGDPGATHPQIWGGWMAFGLD